MLSHGVKQPGSQQDLHVLQWKRWGVLVASSLGTTLNFTQSQTNHASTHQPHARNLDPHPHLHYIKTKGNTLVFVSSLHAK